MSAPYYSIFEFFLNPAIYERRAKVKAEFFGANVMVRLGRSLKSLFGNWWRILRERPDFDATLTGARWVVVGTRNQENSTSFLLSDDRYRLVGANFYTSAGQPAAVDWYPQPKLFYLGRYLSFFWRAYRTNPVHFSRVFQELLHGVGAYENHRKVLRRYRPELIIVSNDHLPWYRALVLAARAEGIRTAYLQHAPVVDDFPSLISDLSLLDGQDALDKYRAGGKAVYGKTVLVGMPKFDPYFPRISATTRLTRLGVPYGFFDEVADIARTVAALRKAFPELVITVRKHPRDERPFPAEEIPGVQFSDARAQSPLEYLLDQDIIIAGDTGIHLEAVLMNVTSLYYQFTGAGESPVDHYGFIRNGLVPTVLSLEELIGRLRELMVHRPVVRGEAEYFVAHLTGEWAGRSGALVLGVLEDG